MSDDQTLSATDGLARLVAERVRLQGRVREVETAQRDAHAQLAAVREQLVTFEARGGRAQRWSLVTPKRARSTTTR